MCKKYIYGVAVSSLLFASISAQAATVGTFFGLSMGTGVVHTPNDYAFDVLDRSALLKRDLGGFSWRLSGGYNFTKYIGLEGAYLRLAPSKYSASGDIANASLNYSDNVGELLLDTYLPFGDYFGFYGKFGMAYISQKVSYRNSNSNVLPLNPNVFSPDITSGTDDTVAPAMAVGVGYSFTPSSMIDLGVSYIYNGADFKTQKDAVADVSYVSLGFRYTFPMLEGRG